MPLDNLQKFKDKLLLNLGLTQTAIAKLNITPAFLSLLSLISGVASALFLAQTHLLFVCLYLTHMLFDGLDGFVARVTYKESAFGNLLDHGGDSIITYLFLLKSLAITDKWLVAVVASIYTCELIFVIALRLTHKKFPPVIFVYFYMFKMYTLGLQVQIIYEIVSFIVVTTSNKLFLGRGGRT